MARVNVPVVAMSRSGVLLGSLGTEVDGDSVNGHYFENTGKEFLTLRNNAGTTRTVTLKVGATVDGQAVVDPTVTLLANEHKIVGPFPEGIYDQTSGDELGNVQIDVDHADVKLQAWKVQ